VPVVLVVGILHRESLFASAHNDCPLFVIGLADNQSDVRLLFYDEDALLGYGDDVDLLDSVTPVHIDVFKDNPFAYGLDVVGREVLADMPDNLVLEEPYAKDNRGEDCGSGVENCHIAGVLERGALSGIYKKLQKASLLTSPTCLFILQPYFENPCDCGIDQLVRTCIRDGAHQPSC